LHALNAQFHKRHIFTKAFKVDDLSNDLRDIKELENREKSKTCEKKED